MPRKKLTGHELTALLHKSMRDVEEARLASLVALYQRALHDAADRASEQFALTAAADWQPPVEGAVLTVAQVAALATTLNKALSPIWTRIILEVGQKPLARVEIAWDVTHPLAQALLQQAGQRTGARLGEAAQFILRDTLATAYNDGLDVRATAALIRSAMSDAAPWQAEMLARTDLNSLSNGASKAAAQLTGMSFKTWDATLDAVTRPEHAEAHGQTVSINDQFLVGGEEADYPGDPALSDAMACNCRCTLVYGETLDEAGGLLADGSIILSEMATKEQRRRKYERRAAHARPQAQARRRSKDDATRAPSDAQAASAEVLSPTDVQWVSDLAFEGMATDDGRYMMPGAIEWRELPIPLMALTETGPGGHQGAFQAGKITEIERDDQFDMDGEPLPEGVVAIRGRGVFDMDGANGAETERLVRDEFVRGVSLDPASIDAVLRDPETGETFAPRDATPEVLERAMFGDLQTAFARYTIGGATVCPIPAFADARIALAAGAQIWMPFRAMAADGTAIIPRCVCAQIAVATSQSTDAAATAKGATNGGDLQERCPIHGALTAGSNSGGSEGNGWGRPAAQSARSKLGNAEGERNTQPSARNNALNTAAKQEKPTSAGERPSVDGGPLTQKPSDNAPESGSTGTTSKPSWRANTIAAPSAEPASHTNRGEEHSRILTWITRQERPSFEDGSADPATEALAASATTQNGSKAQQRTSGPVAPLYPPRSWFETTELPGPCPLTISKDGRVYGHIALFSSCHTGLGDQCVKPPRSASGYANFHVGELATEEGDLIRIGKLMLGAKHAPLSMSAREASRHYDDNGMVGAYVCASDGAFGVWVAGALRHDLSPEHLRDFRANPPSGDWRTINGQLDLVAALAVPVPGYPVPRADAALVAAGGSVDVASLIASPGYVELVPVVMNAIAAAGLLMDADCDCDEDLAAERQMHALAARAEGLEALASLVD